MKKYKFCAICARVIKQRFGVSDTIIRRWALEDRIPAKYMLTSGMVRMTLPKKQSPRRNVRAGGFNNKL